MTDKKISELIAGSVLSGDELVMIVQGGVTKQTTIADIMVGSSTVGGEYLAGETDAMGIDFTYHTDITKQHYISDLTTPANDYNGTAQGKLTYTSPSIKLCRQADGVWRYVNHNLCLESQALGAASWVFTAGGSGTSNTTTAPDGTSTADTWNCGGDFEVVHQSFTNFVVGPVYAFTTYFKYNATTWVRVVLAQDSSGANSVRTWFDIQNGSVGTTSTTGSGYASTLTSTITSAGGGWYRCTMYVTVGHTSAVVYYVTAIADASTTRTGMASYWWGAQLKRYPVNDAGGFTYATGYLATTSSAVYDMPYEWNAALASQGILIEEQRTNIYGASQNWTDAVWSKSNCAATANTTAAPDGTTTADTITASAGTARHSTFQIIGSQAANTTVSWSCFVKKNSHRYILLNAPTDTATHYIAAVFDLDGGGATATETSVGAGSGTIVSTSQVDAGNGWYRISIVGSMNVATNWKYAALAFATAATGNTFATNGDISFNAAGTETFYAWGAQLEVGAFPTSPIHTIGSTVTRAVDNIRLAGASFPLSQTVGTLVVNAQSKFSTSADEAILQLSSDDNERYLIYNSGATDINIITFDGGGVMGAATIGTQTVGTAFKAAMGITALDTDGSLNGAAAVGTNPATLPTTDELLFGINDSAGATWNGYIRQVTYLKRRATNVELQSKTS